MRAFTTGSAADRRRTGPGLHCLVISGLLWGTGGLTCSLLGRVGGLSAIAVAACRLTACGVLIVAFLTVTGRRWPAGRAAWGRITVIGLLAAFYQSCYFTAVSLTSVPLATLVTIGAAPVMVLAADRVSGRRPGRGALVRTGLAVTGLGFTGGGLLLMPLAQLAGGVGFRPGLAAIGLLVALGTGPTAVAYTLYFRGLRSVPAGTAAVLALLEPPFHGRRLRAYEAIVEAEAVREMATWPEGAEFATLDSMMRITLNAILRAVFGADGAELAALRTLLPAMVKLGSRLAVLPIPRTDLGRWSPWGRGLAYRREYDAIVGRLIAAARQDPRLDDRDDVLALMLQSRYDDGAGMSRDEIADQLLTLLTAGHETTATTLAWAVERLRRHPAVLRRLADEADAGGSDLREATILEVQRVRPVIDRTARQVRAPSMRLGRWTLPEGQIVLVSIYLIHSNEALFPHARSFDPDRFAGSRPDTHQWIPFGGGVRRCIGAAFAHMEMNVVLRTLLRDFTLEPTSKRGGRWPSPISTRQG